ncbi:MAG: hypothetical protein J6B26_05380 [Agathobacter sp.]|nr:hypothetical protein [Agathobacter sp.]MBQ2282649.1 hypothetical protein [Agathobacter sp.]
MQIEQAGFVDSSIKKEKGISQYISEGINKDNGIFPGKINTKEGNAQTQISPAESNGDKTVTYHKPGKNEGETAFDELEEQAQMTPEERRNQMAVVSNTTAPEDYQKMWEDGYSMEDMDTSTIITVTDKIQAVLAKAGVDMSVYPNKLSKDQLEKICGNKAVAQQIYSACEQLDSVNKLSDESIEYMIRNELPPTFSNIYFAGCSIGETYGTSTGSRTYNSNGGYASAVYAAHGAKTAASAYSRNVVGSISGNVAGNRGVVVQNAEATQSEAAQKAQTTTKTETQPKELSSRKSQYLPISDATFNVMKRSMTRILNEAGLEATDENFQSCKWLLDRQLPVTPENILYLQDLKGYSLDQLSEKEVVTSMLQSVSEGKSPFEAIMLKGYSMMEIAEDAVETVAQTQDEDLAYCIDQGEEITVSNLKKAVNYRMQGGEAVSIPTGREVALIRARRQIEEVRLVMTAEANYSLLKRGFSIDTKPIEALIEQLKAQENAYYRRIFENHGVENASLKANYLAQTEQIFSELQDMPAYVLNKDIAGESITDVYEKGAVLKDTLDKANEDYETLKTVPRAELGDSILKAFQNVDDILQDLNLECSEANQRAVRILAYNQIPITEQSILEMKVADQKMQQAFTHMTPSVTLEMIRQNRNPLDMSIEELNALAEEIQDQNLGQDEEKFSRYLWKLEQNKQITQEERESYIGIYRLIAQVEKGDHQAIGALLQQGAPVTMRNLLTAIRSQKKTGMDYEIGDDFGGVKEKAYNKPIDQQIETAFIQNTASQIKDIITPEKLQGMDQEQLMNMTPEQLQEYLQGQSTEEMAQLEQQQNVEYAKEQLDYYSKAAICSDDVYAVLDHYDMKNSMMNVISVARMMENPNEMFQKLWKGNSTREKQATVAALKEQIFQRFGEAVKTPEEMAAAQEELAELAEDAMKGMIIEQQNPTSLDVREMKLLCNQFRLCVNRAKEESYMVPVQIGDQVTGVNLKIVRGKREKGFVEIIFHGEQTGKVAASFETRRGGISGMIATDKEETRAFFQNNLEYLKEQIKFSPDQETDISVAMITGLSLSYYEAHNLRHHDTEEVSPVQTKQLYGIAESFLKTVHSMTSGSVE